MICKAKGEFRLIISLKQLHICLRYLCGNTEQMAPEWVSKALSSCPSNNTSGWRRKWRHTLHPERTSTNIQLCSQSVPFRTCRSKRFCHLMKASAEVYVGRLPPPLSWKSRGSRDIWPQILVSFLRAFALKKDRVCVLSDLMFRCLSQFNNYARMRSEA